MSELAELRLESTPPIAVGTRRASLDVAVQVVGRLGNLVLGVVVTLVIVRMLGSRGFGQWATIFAITQIASDFGELGLKQVAVSRAARDPEREPDWLGALISLRLLLALPITAGAAVGILLIAPTPQSRLAGLLIACVPLVTAPQGIAAIFQLRVRNGLAILVMSVNSVLWGVGAIAVALTARSMPYLAVAFLGAQALSTGLAVVLALRLSPVRFACVRVLWPALLRVGVGLGAAGILVTLYVRLDQILVFQLAGSRQAGLYGAAYRILDQIQFVPASVMTTLFPLIASGYPHDLPRVRRLLQSAAEYLAMASLPALAFTIVVPGPIMRLLFGAPFVAAAPALPILLGAFVLISLGYLAGSMVAILEAQRRFFWFAAFGLALNAVLNAFLIPRFGFVAAAWVTLATELTVMSLTMRTVLRRLSMAPLPGRIPKVVAAAAAMGALTWFAHLHGVPLAGLVGVALCSYMAALLSLRALSPAEVMAIVRKEGP